MSYRIYHRERMCKCDKYNLKQCDAVKARAQFDWIENTFGNATRSGVAKRYRISEDKASVFPEIDHEVCFGACIVTTPYGSKYTGGHDSDIFVARLGTPFYCYLTDTLLVCTKEAARRVLGEPPFGWTILPNRYEQIAAKYEQMKDAAEFEARVAEILSDFVAQISEKMSRKDVCC